MRLKIKELKITYRVDLLKEDILESNIDIAVKHMYSNLLRMTFLVQTQINLAVKSLVENDYESSEKVIEDDIKVNNYQRKIEDEAIRVIATQGPVAKDLRIIFTIIKIVTDLERIGDHAKDIADINLITKDYTENLIDDNLVEMGYLVTNMLEKSLDAFIARDKAGALETAKMEKDVIKLQKETVKTLYDKASENPLRLKLAGELNFVLKYLERISDHATNLCEWTVYIVTGEFKEIKYGR